MRSRAALLVAVGLGILAMIMMFRYVRGRESELLQLTELKDVVVAAQDMGANQVIEEQQVVRKQVPATYLQPKALSDPRAVVGRVTAVPLAQGAQILGTSLQEPGETPLAYDVPRGQRAVSILVNEVTAVGGLVRPGNFVDIFGTFKFGRPTGTTPTGQIQYADQRTETRMLAQNVKVVAVGREHRGERIPLPPPGQEDPQAEEVRRRRERPAETVTLLADPRQAQELVLAQELGGTLTLALRSPQDAGTVIDLGLLDQLGLLKVPTPVIPRPEPFAPLFREFRGGS
jgi:pilus assembly protein CpaB